MRYINASLRRGGWECRLVGLGDTDVLERWQNVRIKWRGAFAGEPPGQERTAFDGWVLPQRFQFDRATSEAIYIAQTSDGFLRRGWLQGIGFAEVPARAHYHQFSSDPAGYMCPADPMTLGKLVRHILGYYDTCDDLGPNWIAHTNHVYHPTQNPSGWIHLDNVEVDDSAHVTRYIVRETDNLWSRLREIARNEFFEIVFDKTDTLWYKPHPMYLETLPNPVMTFDEDFCVVPPAVELRDADVVRQVRLHAVTDAGSTLHAYYPLPNVILNPSIENNADGWIASGSTISRSTAHAYDGSASLQIITDNAANEEGAYYSAITLAHDLEFQGSIWVYQVAGGATVRIRIRDETNGTETAGGATVLAAATWTQLTVNHTVGATPSEDLRLYVETTGGAPQNVTFFADLAILSPPAPPVYGKKSDVSRIRCNSQVTLNRWAKRRYLFENRPYTVRWTAPGLCGLLFEILDRVQITYTGTTANGVHIDWTERKFWIHEITVTPDDGFGGTSTFLLEAENIDE